MKPVQSTKEVGHLSSVLEKYQWSHKIHWLWLHFHHTSVNYKKKSQVAQSRLGHWRKKKNKNVNKSGNTTGLVLHALPFRFFSAWLTWWKWRIMWHAAWVTAKDKDRGHWQGIHAADLYLWHWPHWARIYYNINCAQNMCGHCSSWRPCECFNYVTETWEFLFMASWLIRTGGPTKPGHIIF